MKQKNKINKNNKMSNITKDIRSMTVTGFFLALSIIVSLFSNYIKLSFLGSFLTLDLSLVFIIPILFICNIYWALFASTACGAALFLWSHDGLWIGPIFAIISNAIVVINIWFWYFCIFKKIRLTSLRLLTSLSTSFLILIIILILLNGFIFTPLYWWVFNVLKQPWFIEAMNWYNNNGPNPYLLYLPDYWSGIWGLYTAFNSLKFIIVFIIVYFPIVMINKSKIAEKYFYKTNN